MATLLYQAEQGLTTLTDNGSKSWTITGVGDAEAWAKTDDVTRFVGESLGVTQPGAHFKSSPDSVTSGQKLQSVRNALVGTDQRLGRRYRGAAQSELRDASRALAVAAAPPCCSWWSAIFFHPPSRCTCCPSRDSSSAASAS